jgi:dephospho-CoA kinase
MLIAITGGIGSGKSVVSRIVAMMGYDVYDCDSRAKRLMDTDDVIKARLQQEIHPQCVLDGCIDRKRLAEIVFSDADRLEKLNAIVHSAVRDDLRKWAQLQGKVSFVETAILYQSELDRMVDCVWEVEAPLDLRISRVMERNSVSREEVLARISAQDSFIPSRHHPLVIPIINDGMMPLLPQIEAQLAGIKLSHE